MIEIKIQSITCSQDDAIVNAANTFLMPGSGVCGAIFDEAGSEQLQEACNKIGKCEVGKAVITPGFNLKAKYIIHAVGPMWDDGNHDEPKLLASAYKKSLHQARLNDCHSISFPLISAGIFGYPVKEAWNVALTAVSEYLTKHADYPIDVTFCVLDSNIAEIGIEMLRSIRVPETKNSIKKKADSFLFFWHEDEENGIFSNWYKAPFSIEGIVYSHVEQYMMAKKALLFRDIEHYCLIMNTDDPKECKAYGRAVRNFNHDEWLRCDDEIVYNALYAKFSQNPALSDALIQTGDRILAEASPLDRIWGIGLAADDPNVCDQSKWNGENKLGKTLMKVRSVLK